MNEQHEGSNMGRSAWQSQSLDAPPISLAFVHVQVEKLHADFKEHAVLTYLSVAMCVVLALFTFFKPASALGAIEYVNRIGAVFAALGALEIARQVWRRRSRLESRPDDTILQSLQAYRAELQRRRDYYFDTWRWSIWPILPCMGTIIIGGLIYNNRPGAGRVYALVTAISILAIAVGVWHYRRKGLDLQRELDALDTMKRD